MLKTMFKKFYILGILLILLISITLIIQYSYLNNIIIKNKQNNIEKSREILGRGINKELKLYSQIIESISEVVSIRTLSEEEMKTYFKNMMELNPVFNEIYYGDVNNNFINGSDWTPQQSYDSRVRPWYIKAVEKKDIVYSEVYVDVLSNELSMAISKPIYDLEDNLMGVVSGDILINKIIELVEGAEFNNIGYSFLIDGEGHILAHPDYIYEDYSNLKNINEVSPTLLEDMKRKEFGQNQVQINNIEGYLSYQPIEGTDWIIGSFASFDEYNRNNSHLWGILFLVLLLTFFMFATFFLLQNKYFMKPLNRLIDDIENIDLETNISQRIPMDGRDTFFLPRQSINLVLDRTKYLFKQQKEYQEELIASHEELEASYGQLSAMEQELREQYEELSIREKKLYYLSYHDYLTGLYNRRFFVKEFKRLDIEDNFPLGIIIADVNGLKLVNDSFGQEIGDELLRKTGDIIKEVCEDKQVVSRIGGDEFIIILPKTNREEAQNIIETIKKLGKGHRVNNIELSISFGVAIKYDESENISDIIKQAEDDMYSNKLVEGPSMRSKTIDTIIQALYEKNPREREHSNRVATICQQMGKYLKMTDEKIKQLEMVGLLHDIGKVAISDEILEKPDKLNKEEWVKMKQHPEIGWRILSTTSEMSQIAEYVLAHHERYDGTGYPRGLKGKKIPLVSRIIAIADSYDAMISDRPYRKGLPEEVAIKEIIKNSGEQFDPILARLFIEKVLNKEWIEEEKDKKERA